MICHKGAVRDIWVLYKGIKEMDPFFEQEVPFSNDFWKGLYLSTGGLRGENWHECHGFPSKQHRKKLSEKAISDIRIEITGVLPNNSTHNTQHFEKNC